VREQSVTNLAAQLQRAIESGALDAPTLGPLSRELKRGAKWTDEYPSCQLWADELEDLLEFTDEKGQRDRYWKDLRQSNDRRDSALMELRAARYLEQVSLPVIEWFPSGCGNSEGEFLVETPGKHQVFVEVKSPSWKGELFAWNGKERDAGRMERLKQPKYIDGEGGPVAPWQGIRFAIDKAYQKFKNDTPNLLIIADDMHVSLAHGTEIQAHTALYLSMPNDMGYFTDQRYKRLGAVGIFWLGSDVDAREVRYHMRLFLNPKTLTPTALPSDVQELLGDKPAEFLKAETLRYE